MGKLAFFLSAPYSSRIIETGTAGPLLASSRGILPGARLRDLTRNASNAFLNGTEETAGLFLSLFNCHIYKPLSVSLILSHIYGTWEDLFLSQCYAALQIIDLLQGLSSILTS